MSSKIRNVSERSLVLAPFNSTITENTLHEHLVSNIPVRKPSVITFHDRVREANRQYEYNYNGEVDNGIMISHDQDKAEGVRPAQDLEKPHMRILQDDPNEAVHGPQVSQASEASPMPRVGDRSEESSSLNA